MTHNPNSAVEKHIDFESEVGTAKDNLTTPIHDWYKFTAGFSYKFVNHIVGVENLDEKNSIYDPFAGCGTTLVSAQKLGISAVGNEGQEFMHNVISAKLEWTCSSQAVLDILSEMKNKVVTPHARTSDLTSHTLLETLYDADILDELYNIKNCIESLAEEKYRNFFKLALSQTLHRVCQHPIAVPYIARNTVLKRKSGPNPCWNTFATIVRKMNEDLEDFREHQRTSFAFLHDSRAHNPHIADNSCSVCITSPPYLNNLDYGEASKVHTHFYGITQNWNDVTTKVRKKLVTAATTHYSGRNNFETTDWMNSEEGNIEKTLLLEIASISAAIRDAAKVRKAKQKKSFDAMICYYFSDMRKVLIEMRRVLKPEAKAYIILGDSAPYGVLVPTTQILGRLSMDCGFSNYSIQKIRDRGSKWKTLTHRHKIEVSENLLILS